MKSSIIPKWQHNSQHHNSNPLYLLYLAIYQLGFGKKKKSIFFKGECVPSGWRRQPKDGEWGHWNHWSECTKTCGIGVAFQSRQCDSPRPLHGGKYCLGVRRRYRTCNTEVHSEKSLVPLLYSFRAFSLQILQVVKIILRLVR